MRKKEIAIDALKEQRFLDDLNWLRTSVEKGNVKLVEKSIRIGKLRERYSSISGHYGIHLHLDDNEQKVESISYEKKETRQKRSILQGVMWLKQVMRPYPPKKYGDSIQHWRKLNMHSILEIGFGDAAGLSSTGWTDKGLFIYRGARLSFVSQHRASIKRSRGSSKLVHYQRTALNPPTVYSNRER